MLLFSVTKRGVGGVLSPADTGRWNSSVRGVLSMGGISVSFVRCARNLGRESLGIVASLALSMSRKRVLTVLNSDKSNGDLLTRTVFKVLPRGTGLGKAVGCGNGRLSRGSGRRVHKGRVTLVPRSIGFLSPLVGVSSRTVKRARARRRGRRGGRGRERVFRRCGLNPRMSSVCPFRLSKKVTEEILMSATLLSGPGLMMTSRPAPKLSRGAIGRALGRFGRVGRGKVKMLLVARSVRTTLRMTSEVKVFCSKCMVRVTRGRSFAKAKRGLLRPCAGTLCGTLPTGKFGFVPKRRPLRKRVPGKYPCCSEYRVHVKVYGRREPRLVSLKGGGIEYFGCREKLRSKAWEGRCLVWVSFRWRVRVREC